MDFVGEDARVIGKRARESATSMIDDAAHGGGEKRHAFKSAVVRWFYNLSMRQRACRCIVRHLSFKCTPVRDV